MSLSTMTVRPVWIWIWIWARVYLAKKKKKVKRRTRKKKIARSSRLPSVREKATGRILSPGVQKRMKTGRGGSIGPENPSPH
jgi:ribosomal protein L13E